MKTALPIPQSDAALPIVTAGHPALRTIAEAVPDPTDPAIARLGRILANSLYEVGGIGLAAPQVGIGVRVVLFSVPARRLTGAADDFEQGPMVLVNPVITPLGTETEEDWEGCLSLPGLTGRVLRPRRIRYQGVTPDGMMIDRTVGGFHARVVQHECDHLDGTLYPQRMPDMSTLMYADHRLNLTALLAERTAS
ncbi:MAG: peptide deformylase [Elstera sp.]